MKSPKFHPHFNSATGQYHGSEKDYNQTLKRMNLVPYEKPKEKPQQEYKVSAWAHDMVNQISRGSVGQVFQDALKKKGYDIEKMRNAQDRARKMGASGNKGSFGKDY